MSAKSGVTKNAAAAIQRLQASGKWTKNQAAGIVGNLQAESGKNLDPTAEGDKNKAGQYTAYGIAQWHPDRQAEFQRVYNKPIRGSTIDEQLDFVNYELNNTHKSAGNALRGTTTAAEAAVVVDKKYEISALSMKGIHTERIANANVLAGATPEEIAQRGNQAAKSAFVMRDATADEIATNGVLSGARTDSISKTADTTAPNQTPLIFTEVIPNPLLKYPSYTYGLSLHLMTVDEYNLAVTKQKFETNRVLIASAGRWSDSFVREPSFSGDFYFDNLEMETTIGANAHSRSTNAIDIKFTIVEPYGVTLMNRIMYANANIQSKNYIDQPYLLQIDFFAIDDAGVILGSIPTLVKRIPIKFTKLDIKASTKGAEYNCQAVPYNTSAFLVSTASTPTNITIDAGNLQSFFQSEAEETYIAEYAADKNRVAFSKTAAQSMQPDPVAAGNRLNVSLPTTNLLQTQSLGGTAPPPVNMIASQDTLYPKYTDAGKENASSMNPTFKVNSYGTGINAWYKSLTDNNKTDVHDTYLFRIHEDILKKQTFRLQEKMPVDATKMAKNKDDANVQRKANLENSSFSALSYDGRTFSINAGTSIDKVIDFVMRQTEYLQEQITSIDAMPSEKEYVEKYKIYETKPLNWYKIVPTVQLGEYDAKRQQYARVITYNIIPYKIWNCKNKAAPQGQVTTPVKEHNYMYTGENDDVIDLNIEFNALFYNAVTAYEGVMSKSYNLPTDEKEDLKSPDDTEIKPLNPNAVQPLKTQYIVFNQQARATGGEVTALQSALSDVEQSLYTASGAGGGDMIEAKLTIVGDPHYIKQDDIFYPPALSPIAEAVDENGIDPRMIADGHLHMNHEGIYIRINVRSPVDINESTSLMEFQNEYTDSVFSGIYQVIQVNSKFQGGKFTQTLQNVRQPNQPTKDIHEKVKNTNRIKGIDAKVAPPVPDAPQVTNATNSQLELVNQTAGGSNALRDPTVPTTIDPAQKKLAEINKTADTVPIGSQNTPQAVVPNPNAGEIASLNNQLNTAQSNLSANQSTLSNLQQQYNDKITAARAPGNSSMRDSLLSDAESISGEIRSTTMVVEKQQNAITNIRTRINTLST